MVMKRALIVFLFVFVGCGQIKSASVKRSNEAQTEAPALSPLPSDLASDRAVSSIENFANRSARVERACQNWANNPDNQPYYEVQPNSGARCEPYYNQAYDKGYIFECDPQRKVVEKSVKGEASRVLREMLDVLEIPAADADRVDFHFVNTPTINAYTWSPYDHSYKKEQHVVVFFRGLVEKFSGLGDGPLLAVMAHEYGHRVFDSHGNHSRLFNAARDRFVESCRNVRSKSEFQAALSRYRNDLFKMRWESEKFADDYINQVYRRITSKGKLTFNPFDAVNTFEVFDILSNRSPHHPDDPHRSNSDRKSSIFRQISNPRLSFENSNIVDRRFGERLLRLSR